MSNLTKNIGRIEGDKQLLGALINPIPVTEFMETYWQQKPTRGLPDRRILDYFKNVLSFAAIDKMLCKNHIEYTKHIVLQKKGEEMLTPKGRAMPPSLWNHYNSGACIHILNAQSFIPVIQDIIATLQEYFQCVIVSNIYLCSSSDGCAPRCEDTDMFVLQMQGEMHLRVHNPLQNENSLDVDLKAGELLYVPHGFIHEATSHIGSLHLTLNIRRTPTFSDLLKMLYPRALKVALSEEVPLRKNLPVKMWDCLGLVNEELNLEDDRIRIKQRTLILEEIRTHLKTVHHYVKLDSNLDAAVDQMALQYQSEALPPTLTADEELRSVYGTKLTINANNCPEYIYINLDTKIRLIRGNLVRMVKHDNDFRVYYSSENSNDYQQIDENYIEINASHVPAIKGKILNFI